MAETATLLGNVSELDLTDSMSYLTSAVKTFNLEASESLHVVNALNEIDNNFAVNVAAHTGNSVTNQISELLRRCA